MKLSDREFLELYMRAGDDIKIAVAQILTTPQPLSVLPETPSDKDHTTP